MIASECGKAVWEYNNGRRHAALCNELINSLRQGGLEIAPGDATRPGVGESGEFEEYRISSVPVARVVILGR